MTLDKVQGFWLRTGAVLTAGFGVLIWLAAFPGLSGPLKMTADLVLWPGQGAQSLGAPDTRLMAAILGGVLVGWAEMIWLLAGTPLATAIRRWSGGSS